MCKAWEFHQRKGYYWWARRGRTVIAKDGDAYVNASWLGMDTAANRVVILRARCTSITLFQSDWVDQI
jgi:hypothetical protein